MTESQPDNHISEPPFAQPIDDAQQELPKLRHREITTHRVNQCNEALRIEVLDEPGPGGASHSYRISGFQASALFPPGSFTPSVFLPFQNGPIMEVGVNGITNEVLLAIVLDRMHAWQKGPYACGENEVAIQHLERAVATMAQRTERRVAQGVEGTMEGS